MNRTWNKGAAGPAGNNLCKDMNTGWTKIVSQGRIPHRSVGEEGVSPEAKFTFGRLVPGFFLAQKTHNACYEQALLDRRCTFMSR